MVSWFFPQNIWFLLQNGQPACLSNDWLADLTLKLLVVNLFVPQNGRPICPSKWSTYLSLNILWSTYLSLKMDNLFVPQNNQPICPSIWSAYLSLKWTIWQCDKMDNLTIFLYLEFGQTICPSLFVHQNGKSTCLSNLITFLYPKFGQLVCPSKWSACLTLTISGFSFKMVNLLVSQIG